MGRFQVSLFSFLSVIVYSLEIYMKFIQSNPTDFLQHGLLWPPALVTYLLEVIMKFSCQASTHNTFGEGHCLKLSF